MALLDGQIFVYMHVCLNSRALMILDASSSVLFFVSCTLNRNDALP